MSDQLNVGNTGWLSTYYVYDDLDRLRFVIPPKAVDLIKSTWVINSAVASELCYLYRYDGQGRMIVKKLPAADSVEMVYDKRDRLIASRDGNLKFRQFWNVKYYDTQNRERMSGLLYFGYNREQMQTNVDASAFDPANSFPFLPESGVQDLVKTFYDDYSYSGSIAYNAGDITKPQASGNLYAEALPAAASKATRGMVTGKKARVDYGDQFLMSSVYYDDKGRTIQSAEDNMRGGRETTTNLYAFNGKVLSSYLRHTNPQSTTTPQTTLLSMYHYDAGGRIDSVKKRLNDNVALQQTIAVNEYDELGNLKIKRLSPTGASTQLESLNYDYNIRGWMTGLNKSFVNTTSTANWFGMELNYDYGFGVQELNGNIAGTKWKSRSDGIARSYGFDYDNSNRFITASFTQQNAGSSTWSKDKADFSVTGLSYDQNGNILSMKQIGLNGITLQTIDSLKYGYIANSNRLSFVTDKVNNAQSILGDFKEITNNESADYLYDPSGNMCRDNNKDIDSVFYTHLNLPSIVYLKDVKAKIFYQYDGSGKKLSKIVWDSTGTTLVVRITYYMNGLVYQKDTLEFIAHEEGRIRPVFRTGQPVSYAYDYFVKDHLGSTRMILSTKTDTAVYAATMETAASEVENALFNNIDNTRSPKPAAYPVDNTTNPNTYVSKLNAVNGQKIGPSLVLRVMANDTIRISVKALYKNAGANTSSSTSASMVSSILQAFSGNGISQGVHNSSGSGSPITTFTNANYDQLKAQDNSQNLANKPKAYLNYVLFDDMFNMVTENSGIRQVQGDIDSLATLFLSNTTIKKTGFLYIYVSNESGQDVYFDNLIVTHTSGALLEETHYYPHGLTMAGISSTALKGANYPENRKKFTGQELDNDLDLDWYQFRYRAMDPQIGRFIQIDPLCIKYPSNSTYSYAENRVTMGIDLEGLELLPFNSSWFRAVTVKQPVYGTNLSYQREQVNVIVNSVPDVFKDESGMPLFSAASVGVTPNGEINAPDGYAIKEANGLPTPPGWTWDEGDPEATGNTGGWAIGNDLERNKDFADKSSAVGGAAQEVHKWITTFGSNVSIWNANAALKLNISSYNKAASVVKSSSSSLSITQKADLINFVNDGTLPSVNLKNFQSSLQKGMDVMKAGMRIMNKNNIKVNESTRRIYESYKAVLDFLNNSKK